jgi:uncharacterized membrane protein (UPF0127 family)
MPSRVLPGFAPKQIIFTLLAIVTVLFPAACNSQSLETRELTIEKAAGEKVAIRAEIARTPDQLQRGLMFRKTLADGRGMLFVFNQDQILSFWMKNTLVPLSIAYIRSDGSILEIRDMVPRDENTVRSSRGARYALEVPQGGFGRVGVKAGDRLLLPGI